jgi:hypothetical protein
MRFSPQTIVLALMACGMVLASTSADARSRNNSNHPWCLESSIGFGGGGTRIDCRFSSREQCVQSRVAHGDRCMKNPRTSPRRR